MPTTSGPSAAALLGELRDPRQSHLVDLLGGLARRGEGAQGRVVGASATRHPAQPVLLLGTLERQHLVASTSRNAPIPGRPRISPPPAAAPSRASAFGTGGGGEVASNGSSATGSASISPSSTTLSAAANPAGPGRRRRPRAAARPAPGRSGPARGTSPRGPRRPRGRAAPASADHERHLHLHAEEGSAARLYHPGLDQVTRCRRRRLSTSRVTRAARPLVRGRSPGRSATPAAPRCRRPPPPGWPPRTAGPA